MRNLNKTKKIIIIHSFHFPFNLSHPPFLSLPLYAPFTLHHIFTLSSLLSLPTSFSPSLPSSLLLSLLPFLSLCSLYSPPHLYPILSSFPTSLLLSFPPFLPPSLPPSLQQLVRTASGCQEGVSRGYKCQALCRVRLSRVREVERKVSRRGRR